MKNFYLYIAIFHLLKKFNTFIPIIYSIFTKFFARKICRERERMKERKVQFYYA